MGRPGYLAVPGGDRAKSAGPVAELPQGRHLMPAVVVDTHTIVWYLSADPRLSANAAEALDSATAELTTQGVSDTNREIAIVLFDTRKMSLVKSPNMTVASWTVFSSPLNALVPSWPGSILSSPRPCMVPALRVEVDRNST